VHIEHDRAFNRFDGSRQTLHSLCIAPFAEIRHTFDYSFHTLSPLAVASVLENQSRSRRDLHAFVSSTQAKSFITPEQSLSAWCLT
jgi:hypothetical protein